MPFPTTRSPDGFGRANVARVIFNHVKAIEAWCDELLAGPVNSATVQILIDECRALQIQANKVEGASARSEVVAAVTDYVNAEMGKSYTPAQIGAALTELKQAIDVFVPAALAAAPTVQLAGFNFICEHIRNAAGDRVGADFTQQQAAAMVALVQALRGALGGA